MKLIHNFWTKLAVLALAALALTACGDEAPDTSSSDSGFRPGVFEWPNVLTHKPWGGECVHFSIKDPKLTYSEDLSVTFLPDKTGTLIYSNPYQKVDLKFEFSYLIEGLRVYCKGVLSSSEGIIDPLYTLEFEYNELDRLCPLSENFKMFTLTQVAKLQTNKYGIVIKDIAIGNIYQCWLHENGLNILDLRRSGLFQLIQLKTKGEKKFDYSYRITGDVKNYYLYIGCEPYLEFRWFVADCSAEKLILESEVGLETYHAVELSQIPNESDVESVMNNATLWTRYLGRELTCELTLNPDGTCKYYYNTISSKGCMVSASGTYRRNATTVDFHFTEVSTLNYDGREIPVLGFEPGEPCEVTTQYEISTLTTIKFQLPGTTTFETLHANGINGTWNAGGEL